MVFLDTPVSSTNKTERHDIHVADILLKVALNTWTQNASKCFDVDCFFFLNNMTYIKIYNTWDMYFNQPAPPLYHTINKSIVIL